MSELGPLRAEYKLLAGKNPSPALKADALRAKIDELKAAAAPPAQDPPAQDPPAQDPPAQDPPAQDPPAQDPPAQDPPAAAPEGPAPSAGDEPAPESEQEQSVEDACAELGIEIDADGNATVVLTVSMAGAEVKAPGDLHHSAADEAVRLIRAGFAKVRG